MVIDPQKHAELQRSLVKSRVFQRIFNKVNHPEHKPDDDKLKPNDDDLITFWTTWPERLSCASVFGFFFQMKPVSEEKSEEKKSH